MELVASCSIALVCFKRDRFSIFTFVLTPRTKYFEVNNVINKEKRGVNCLCISRSQLYALCKFCSYLAGKQLIAERCDSGIAFL